jgi:hypothetical protein
MPARSNIVGEWIAPAERMTSRADKSWTAPSRSAVTPTTLPPSKRNAVTFVCAITTRFARRRTSAVR